MASLDMRCRHFSDEIVTIFESISHLDPMEEKEDWKSWLFFDRGCHRIPRGSPICLIVFRSKVKEGEEEVPRAETVGT